MREPEQSHGIIQQEIQIAQFIPPHLRERVEKSPNHKIMSFHTAEIMFLAMMPKVKPWDNKLVRQAVAYAIDRDTIIRTLLRGEASRLDGPIGMGQYGYDPNLQPKYATIRRRHGSLSTSRLSKRSGRGALDSRRAVHIG
jgi:peptide/nickel transport system substrate-binding protein